MPFIPHNKTDIKEMLGTIKAGSIDDLFDEIPKNLLIDQLKEVPQALSEMEITRLMRKRALLDEKLLCFTGAGAYDHHIPAVVWDIATRGEFYSAYTPYQAEASQGTLQTIYEYQTMMANLTGLDVSNASMYDGASSVAEAILMAVRANRNSDSRKVLFVSGVNCTYQKVVTTICQGQGLTFDRLPLDIDTGKTNVDELSEYDQSPVAVVIQHPSFFGTLENVDAITDWAHEMGALVIAVTNPISLALLKSPGEWGKNGADICCGEGQPLGIPLSYGGPYFGFITCKKEFLRQIPGRLVGCTTDQKGRRSFTLTLQAREQHIRRSKATSNICTNQGLMVTAATIYMSLLGFKGLRSVAQKSHEQTFKLIQQLTSINGIKTIFSEPYFHEVAIKLDHPVDYVLEQLSLRNILGGYDLTSDFPQLENSLLVCVTETKTDEDITIFAEAMKEIMI
ncbi:uncharacterized protein METZ01_LOCUS65976 [marine metagenome]|uniref:glycine dehydrogenase (aminomethyl-transferring) n=1 Tax=marine metagenome TaxID=408172 RepID=A0A381TAA9_9ZZZZ